MRCIHCSEKKTGVVNSRETKKGFVTWRRRQCQNCRRVFTTTESGHADNLFVIKSNGTRQRFVYEKLFASIFSVLNSMKNHDNGDDALLSKKISEKIIQKILSTTKIKDIKTSDVIVLVYGELKKIDHALAERYIYYSDHRRRVGLKESLL